MTIATWIAELLCPQVFADQRAYARMKAEAIDAYHWLRGYPDAADALRWLLDNDQNRHRAIGEKAIGVLPSDISGFRSMLDTRHNQQQEEIRKLRDIAYHLGNGCAPGNIDLLEMIANEIDCGRDCEHGSTEWDTTLSIAAKSTKVRAQAPMPKSCASWQKRSAIDWSWHQSRGRRQPQALRSSLRARSLNFT
ncbi:hypothetical protein [Agrobacterium vitis]|uniref:hypothetical protein n=1 Tax=Agrobacterium vitis TaxID=373 RepID=UPI002034E2DA|nr:hypothetical protein [Agrobacterium vitis]MCM2453377.1 hypothetical protein [Agrobacterium vitis]